jgi:hypothetical protein
MQASGRVDQGDVYLAGNRCLDCVISYCPWITIGLASNNWQVDSFSPNLQLVNGRGAIGICCSQDDPHTLI